MPDIPEWLNVRGQGEDIALVVGDELKGLMDMPLREGDEIYLEGDGFRVLLTVGDLRGDIYSGLVQWFESMDNPKNTFTDYKGVVRGGPIYFTEQHVFAVRM